MKPEVYKQMLMLRLDHADYLDDRKKQYGIPYSETVRQALDVFIKSNPNKRKK